MKLSLSVTALLSVAIHCNHAVLCQGQQPVRVAVIGGGISGLTAAYELEKKGGYSVTVYEALDYVGGKMQSVQLAPGAPTIDYLNMTEELQAAATEYCGLQNYTNLGAALTLTGAATPGASPPVMYAEELGVPYGHVIFEDLVTVSLGDQSMRLTPQEYLGLLIKQTNPNATQIEIGGVAMEQVQNFGASVAMFIEHIQKSNLVGQADTDLALSMTDFAAKHGFSIYLEALRPFISGYGYGYFEKIPAASVMKIISSVTQKKSPFIGFPCGAQSLAEGMAATLEDVRLSAPVTKVEKMDNGLEVQADGQPTETYDKVIFATTLDLVRSMMMLAPEVDELFSKLFTLRYITTIFEQEGIDTTSTLDFYAAGTYEANQNSISLIPWTANPGDVAATAYQFASPDASLSDLSDRLSADLQFYWGANVTEVVLQREWTNYYPQVSVDDFAAGFFDQVDALQGEDGIYYVGSQFSFELLSNTMRDSKEFIESRFESMGEVDSTMGGDEVDSMGSDKVDSNGGDEGETPIVDEPSEDEGELPSMDQTLESSSGVSVKNSMSVIDLSILMGGLVFAVRG
ncbi:Flavin containing amine oxidoreductase [Seminavis robusta]|uniref:Flavin containing amine oxidoreductase n=1 Tax=Seminavis robusta TaxID=568900 RepID=A0A9N8HWH9_9STRA|nr:Flavin containing amine oxidoreductase [Seminavis robusta]|eukprot:Sro1978_g309050.1 Flavin containing amine oxidoreductase (572) ;mRNA; f:12022-13737